MHSTRILIFAIVASAAVGFAFRPAAVIAAAISPEERIARSVDKISDQLRELTRAVATADRNVECRCK